MQKKTPGRQRNIVSEPDFGKVHNEYHSRKGVTLELFWQEWLAEVVAIELGYRATALSTSTSGLGRKLD